MKEQRTFPKGSNRVNRGGSWNNSAENCRVSNRNRNTPDNRNNNLGLRLALQLSPLGLRNGMRKEQEMCPARTHGMCGEWAERASATGSAAFSSREAGERRCIPVCEIKKISEI